MLSPLSVMVVGYKKYAVDAVYLLIQNFRCCAVCFPSPLESAQP